MKYEDFVSDEPLEIIEGNECSYHKQELATQRFRRVFNEYHAAKANAERYREALDKASYALFQVKRLVDAGPVTQQFVRDAYDEATQAFPK